MGTSRNLPALLLLVGTALSTSGCARPRESAPLVDAPPAHPIVGTWIVHDPNAPFPYHLYVFSADGTMHQANPDAGDPRMSDSDGKGVWQARGDGVAVKWVELAADRTTHQYTGRLELTMRITVKGDSLTAFETVKVFDANGAAAPAPETPKPLLGARVTLP